MKSHLKLSLAVGALVLRFLFAGTETAIAQDTSGADQQGGGQRGAMLSSLSAEDKMKFIKARRQVLANNADLKAEQDDLTKQRQALKSEGSDATSDERKALFQNFMAHEKKMKAAMLQVDPSLQPVFDQIDEKMKEKFQQHAAQSDSGN